MADRPGDQADANGHGGLLSPVSLALGVLSGGIRRVRELPETAARLPVRGLNLALVLTEKAQREASSLQHRGMQVLDLISALRGGHDEAADVDAALARARANVSDPGGTATVADLTERAAQRAGDEPGAAEPAATPRRGRAKTKPTTKRPAAGPRQPAKRAGSRPDLAAEAIDAGAPGAASDVAARAEQEATDDRVVSGAELRAAELPLSDFDQLSIGSLRSRLPRLDRDQLVQLLTYERAHADRLQVVTMIENRIAKVEHDAAGAAATPATTPAKTPGKTPARKTAGKAPAKKAASRPATPAGAGAAAGNGATADVGPAASAEPGGTELDQPVPSPDADAAQDAAEDFGSNSPHP